MSPPLVRITKVTFVQKMEALLLLFSVSISILASANTSCKDDFLALAKISMVSEKLGAQRKNIKAPGSLMRETPRDISRVSVIVPIHNEHGNGNLKTIVRDLVAQQGTEPSKLQIVFVVNNSVESARNRDAKFIDNQNAIRWLQQQRPNLPFSISIVDLSSQGAERNMGNFRIAGVNSALKMANETPLNQHVLVMMDADTIFPSSYLSDVRKHFETNNTDLLLSRYRLVPSQDKNLTTLLSYPASLYQFRFDLLIRALQKGAHSATTPQMSVLASSYLEVGGFPKTIRNEDIILSRRMAPRSVAYSSDLYVKAQDRARLEGFNSKDRVGVNRDFEAGKILAPEAQSSSWALLSNLVRRLEKKVENGQISKDEAVDQIKKILNSAGLKTDFNVSTETNRPLFFAMKDQLDTKTASFAEDLLGLISRLLPASESDQVALELESHRWQHLGKVNSRLSAIREIIGSKSPIENPTGDRFISQLISDDSELRKIVFSVAKQTESIDDCIRILVQKWPEFLGTWDKAPFTRGAAALDILEENILRAKESSDSSPAWARLIDQLWIDVLSKDISK